MGLIRNSDSYGRKKTVDARSLTRFSDERAYESFKGQLGISIDTEICVDTVLQLLLTWQPAPCDVLVSKHVIRTCILYNRYIIMASSVYHMVRRRTRSTRFIRIFVIHV